MKLDEAKELLSIAGLKVKSEDRLGNDTGFQLKLENGGIVNIFDTGTFQVQGKCQPEIKAALGTETKTSTSPKSATTASCPVIQKDINNCA